ncbi:MAG TPA: hypothetical protein VHL52_13775 [Acidimicrobiia bacterium]|nr:hypothetical protein [Acidimicrobiia bacterium]
MNASDVLGDRDTPALRVRLLPVRPANVDVRRFPRWLDRVWPKWVGAVTMPWAIYVRNAVLEGDSDRLSRLIVHELIHVQQWKTHGVVGFLRHYLEDYTRARLRRMSHHDAYRAITLEAEAREAVDLL